MRHLIPAAVDGPVEQAYADLQLPPPPPGGGRPSVSINMIASVDGATAVDGRSGPLGGLADAAAFDRLRAACDAIVVGAGTVRAERYGVPRGTETRRMARSRAGLAPVPRLVIVSGRLDLSPDSAVFDVRSGEPRPVVVTRDGGSASARERLEQVAEVRVHGTDVVDLADALCRLRADGMSRILCEGGPTLNAALVAEGLVDEVFLTVAPCLTGGDAPRILAGPVLTAPRPLELLELREHDGELLTRWRVGDPPTDDRTGGR